MGAATRALAEGARGTGSCTGARDGDLDEGTARCARICAWIRERSCGRMRSAGAGTGAGARAGAGAGAEGLRAAWKMVLVGAWSWARWGRKWRTGAVPGAAGMEGAVRCEIGCAWVGIPRGSRG